MRTALIFSWKCWGWGPRGREVLPLPSPGSLCTCPAVRAFRERPWSGKVLRPHLEVPLDLRAPCHALAIMFARKSALACARGAVSSSQFCRLLRFGRVSHLSFKVTPTASPAAGASVRQASSLCLKPSSFHPHGGVCFSWWEKHRGHGLCSAQPWERPSSCAQRPVVTGLPPEGPAHPLWLCSGFAVSERLPWPHPGCV